MFGDLDKGAENGGMPYLPKNILILSMDVIIILDDKNNILSRKYNDNVGKLDELVTISCSLSCIIGIDGNWKYDISTLTINNKVVEVKSNNDFDKFSRYFKIRRINSEDTCFCNKALQPGNAIILDIYIAK